MTEIVGSGAGGHNATPSAPALVAPTHPETESPDGC
jgi:hypothetical protein